VAGCGPYAPATSGFVKVVPTPAPVVDHLTKVVDDWIEMERKARAWDAAVKLAEEAYPTGLTPHDLRVTYAAV
jgi:hypothetical protein